MDFKVWDPETVPNKTNAAPVVSMSKNGVITFSKPAAEIIGAAVGSKVVFATSGDGNAYVRVVAPEEKGWEIREKTSGKYTSLVMQSTEIAKMFRGLAKSDDNTVTLLVSNAGFTPPPTASKALKSAPQWYPVITSYHNQRKEGNNAN